MASTVAVLLLLSAGLFSVGFGDDCISYTTRNNVYMPSISCSGLLSQHCCGDCDLRFCCFFDYMKISTAEQLACAFQNDDVLIIVFGVLGVVVTCVVFLICCCCPCCCIYRMCRTPRPVAGAHVTTVMSTQSIQQPLVTQPAQYPAYKPEPTHPGYSAQPMQTGPYQGQPYAPGPPPPYHMAASPGYPSVQAPYDGSQATYPMIPPAQPGIAYPPPVSFEQPAYNPAYMQPPKTGY
ncbi:protein shisa-5-like [Pimephales promelas]|uniref:protein shisa-5-like n=1 Tax=Pimephales promelas TaxID=90988 RepID=UPI001955C4CB|nr:protein shisa-5-like [Pimephales promelas]